MRVAVYVIPKEQGRGAPITHPLIESIWDNEREAASRAVQILSEKGFTEVILTVVPDDSGKSSSTP